MSRRELAFKIIALIVGVMIGVWLSYKLFNYQPILGFAIMLVLIYTVVVFPYEKVFMKSENKDEDEISKQVN